jgi:hypothetical protein
MGIFPSTKRRCTILLVNEDHCNGEAFCKTGSDKKEVKTYAVAYEYSSSPGNIHIHSHANVYLSKEIGRRMST